MQGKAHREGCIMSNSEQKNESSQDRDHSSDFVSLMPSAVLTACTKLQRALDEYAIAQRKLDGEYCLYSPITEIDASLGRIRSARRECGELAERIFQMFPETPLEIDAVHNIMNSYRAQVDVDQMPCKSSNNDTSQGNRVLGTETAQMEFQTEQRSAFNVFHWGKWPKRSLLPKRR